MKHLLLKIDRTFKIKLILITHQLVNLCSAHLLFVSGLQVPLQALQVATDLPQQQSQSVHDHVHLLLGLQTLAALGPALLRRLALRFGRDQQLSRELLQGGHLLLRVQQLPLDLLQGGEEEMTSFTTRFFQLC